MPNETKNLIRANEHKVDQYRSHPLNENSSICLRPLGSLTGLKRVVVMQGRVAPGKESFVYHSHQHEEEFLYILAGRGIAEIGDHEFEVGPGDFMGFPTPSVGHHLRNPFDEELVYLMGGEHRDAEVADFPRLRKRFFRSRASVGIVDYDDIASW